MKYSDHSEAADDWVEEHLPGTVPGTVPGTAPVVPLACAERRGRADRRHRIWWSIIYGSFNPRRRMPPRRRSESRFHSLDWHAPHLLGVSIGILLLSVADALMTVTLLSAGADEVNPFMAAVVCRGALMFAVIKMTLTGCGVVMLVTMARYRLLRVVRADAVLYAVLVAYTALLGYEFSMLQS